MLTPRGEVHIQIGEKEIALTPGHHEDSSTLWSEEVIIPAKETGCQGYSAQPPRSTSNLSDSEVVLGSIGKARLQPIKEKQDGNEEDSDPEELFSDNAKSVVDGDEENLKNPMEEEQAKDKNVEDETPELLKGDATSVPQPP